MSRRSHARGRQGLLHALLGSALLLPTTASAVTVTDTGQGAVALAPSAHDAHQLSGLVHEGGTDFLAVSDSSVSLFELTIAIDPASGEITQASVVGAQLLAAGSDLEGIVMFEGGTVMVSDETGPAIREHDPADGSLLSSVSVPAIYSQARNNYSLESLALRLAPDPADDALWTVNEEALTVDGPLATGTQGSWVRLQRFDENDNPDGQWAYQTDPYPGGPFMGFERSGAVELLALSSGELLVLERSVSNQAVRIRLYEVDFSGATDTTNLASLANDPFVPVAKTLRFEHFPGFANNYEGIALGPMLAAGDQSLLLISDDGDGQTAQSLYALRIDYLPEPSRASGLAAAFPLLGLLARRHRGRQP